MGYRYRQTRVRFIRLHGHLGEAPAAPEPELWPLALLGCVPLLDSVSLQVPLSLAAGLCRPLPKPLHRTACPLGGEEVAVAQSLSYQDKYLLMLSLKLK